MKQIDKIIISMEYEINSEAYIFLPTISNNKLVIYHEGHGGYNNKTYENKAWLIDVAKNVEKKSNTYKSQLSQCRTKLDKNRVWTLF